MAAPDYHDGTSEGDVPKGPLTFVPKKTVPKGTSIGIRPSHRASYVIMTNTSEVEMFWGVTKAGTEAGNNFPIAAGASHTLTDIEDVPLIVVYEPLGVTDGEIAMVFRETRRIPSGIELTVAATFPAYNEADSDSIVPGVA